MASFPRPSVRELIWFLERRGFTVLRIRGSHRVLSNGDLQTMVPVHGNETLKVGTLRSILRDVNLSPAEFEHAWNSEK